MAIGEFEIGVTYNLNHVSESDFLFYLDKLSEDIDSHILLISRLPQRRLLEHIDLDKIESYWMTTHDVAGSIQPSLDQLSDLLISRIDNHAGVAFVEGVEWLISLHGFQSVLQFVMKIKDALHRKPWSVIFVVAEDIFTEVESAKWLRESLEWKIPGLQAENLPVKDDTIDDTEPSEELAPVMVDGEEKLAFLVRIPREGYSKEIVRKRILQWRRMGLDVSEAEPALFQDSDDIGYEIYKKVENKVRTAIELDNRLDLLLEQGWKSDVTKLRFRIRQLTGFDEVEERINELI